MRNTLLATGRGVESSYDKIHLFDALGFRESKTVAPGVDPASVGATAADSIVVAPPATGTILVVLDQPALAAAVYTFLVAWNGHPDLDRPKPAAVELVSWATPRNELG